MPNSDSSNDYRHVLTEEKLIEHLAAMENRLAAMEKRIVAKLTGRELKVKKEIISPFIRQRDAIKLLNGRSILRRCEIAGWLVATTRQRKLVQYKREDVMVCVYRISQGELT
jgi:hypothetical protein